MIPELKYLNRSLHQPVKRSQGERVVLSLMRWLFFGMVILGATFLPDVWAADTALEAIAYAILSCGFFFIGIKFLDDRRKMIEGNKTLDRRIVISNKRMRDLAEQIISEKHVNKEG